MAKRSRGPGNTRGGSRPKALRDGERKAIELLKDAADKFGEDDPIVQECTMILICCARGETGYKGRHIGTRIRAVNRLLDQRLGKPGEAPPRDGAQTGPLKIVFNEVEGVGLPNDDSGTTAQ